MSNERIGCTVIYDEREVFYDVGLRLKGSEHSRTTTPRLGFNVELQLRAAVPRHAPHRGHRPLREHRLRPARDAHPPDRSTTPAACPPSITTSSRSWPRGRNTPARRSCSWPATPTCSSTTSSRTASDGTVFEYELVYQLNSTDNGTPEGQQGARPRFRGRHAHPQPRRRQGSLPLDVADQEQRGPRRLQPHDRTSARAMELTRRRPSTAQITNVIDVDAMAARRRRQRARPAWATATAATARSTTSSSTSGPSDGRVLYFPHDMDAFFDAEPRRSCRTATSPNSSPSRPTPAPTTATCSTSSPRPTTRPT